LVGEADGAVAVVTGAAGGLGLGLARQLGARGARIVMVDVDPGTGLKRPRYQT
jgi:NAD(P)-dependent dehydrogenase (short-subunit alcohol dehydrogenase family)